MRVECWVKLSADGGINVVGDPEHSVSGVMRQMFDWLQRGLARCERAPTRPLKRVGPKGAGRFEPTSWNEAISDIAYRLKMIRGRDGADRRHLGQTHYTEHAR